MGEGRMEDRSGLIVGDPSDLPDGEVAVTSKR